jgi:hypothetical protein
MKIPQFSMVAIFAVVAVIGFSAFNLSTSQKSPNDLVTLYLDGNATDPIDVADESKWKEDADEEVSCPTGSVKACTMQVNEAYLTGTAPHRTLDVADIQLAASAGSGIPGSGFVPSQLSGTGSIQQITNRN